MIESGVSLGRSGGCEQDKGLIPMVRWTMNTSVPASIRVKLNDPAVPARLDGNDRRRAALAHDRTLARRGAGGHR